MNSIMREDELHHHYGRSLISDMDSQNRQSKTGPGDGSRHPRQKSAFREWRPIQDSKNGPQRRGMCDHRECGVGDATGWLPWKDSICQMLQDRNPFEIRR